MEIKKPVTSADYLVWIDKDKDKGPDFWVNPQYETIISADDTVAPPVGLIEMVRKFAHNVTIPKERNLEAEINNEIEYEKHHTDVAKKMTLNNQTY